MYTESTILKILVESIQKATISIEDFKLALSQFGIETNTDEINETIKKLGEVK